MLLFTFYSLQIQAKFIIETEKVVIWMESDKFSTSGNKTDTYVEQFQLLWLMNGVYMHISESPYHGNTRSATVSPVMLKKRIISNKEVKMWMNKPTFFQIWSSV